VGERQPGLTVSELRAAIGLSRERLEDAYCRS
jgi:hypothetical protein